MKQGNQLERKIKEFDWKEWTPFIGLYYAPRNIIKGKKSQSLEWREALNGCYHAFVSILPIIHAISQGVDKYL